MQHAVLIVVVRGVVAGTTDAWGAAGRGDIPAGVVLDGVVIKPVGVIDIHTHDVRGTVGLDAQENRLCQRGVVADTDAEDKRAAGAGGNALAVPADGRLVGISGEGRVLEGDGVGIDVGFYVDGAVLAVVIADVDPVREHAAALCRIGRACCADGHRTRAIDRRVLACVDGKIRPVEERAAAERRRGSGGGIRTSLTVDAPVDTLARAIPLVAQRALRILVRQTTCGGDSRKKQEGAENRCQKSVHGQYVILYRATLSMILSTEPYWRGFF